MSNAKQEAIKKAYGEYWDALKIWVNENGWCSKRKGVGFEEIRQQIPIDTNGYSFRPKSLSGIENNNGWNKVEDIGLPKEEGYYDLVCDDGMLYGEIYFYQNKFIGHGDFQYNATHWRDFNETRPIY